MNLHSQAEQLQTALDLLHAIQNPVALKIPLGQLARAIDQYVYAVGLIEMTEVGYIETVKVQRRDKNDTALREEISTRFPQLGCYWTALDCRINNEVDGQLAVGDAIDDLLDITKELSEVEWTKTHHGVEEALAALRFRHSHHLYMHVFPLRRYLEEIIREG